MRKLSKALLGVVSMLLAMTCIVGCGTTSSGNSGSTGDNGDSGYSSGIIDDSGSAGNESPSPKTYEAMTYNTNSEYVDGVLQYDEDLLRRNDFSDTIADPSVLYVDDEEREDYGTFYLYYTTVYAKSTTCCYSNDMENWTKTGCILSDAVVRSNCLDDQVYAPHVIYDKGQSKYYMFVSGLPKNAQMGMVFLLSSDNPYGPFDFVDVGGKNRAKSYQDKNGNNVSCDDYWAEYMYFDPAQYAARVIELEKEIGNDNLYKNYNFGGYFSNIDPYAFIDDDGTRYVYFVFRSMNYRYLAGVQCGESFADVKYETLTLLTLGGHMDVQGTTKCSYQTDSKIDEGPNMLKHNGKYYLTYSFGNLETTYEVGQAVSDSPLGPFRKLELSENGRLLSDDRRYASFTNPGGHDIVEVNGKTYIVYHRNITFTPATTPYVRCFGADELKWVTIKDKFGNDLDVMYANGPTINLQPKFDFVSDYHNIASQATVKATNLDIGSSADYLTDGLWSIYNYDDEKFIDKYVKETVVTKKTTITLTFDDYVSMRGLMIYNSKLLYQSFANVERVEFDCKNADGTEIVKYITDLQVDWNTNKHANNEKYYKSAVAAIATFEEIQCKEIRITIDVPEMGWSINDEGKLVFDTYRPTFTPEGVVGISEIVVLGK